MNEELFWDDVWPCKKVSLFLCFLGYLFLNSQNLFAAAESPISLDGETSETPIVRLNWNAEYPKLMEMGFKEWTPPNGNGSISHEKVLLGDLLKALNLNRKSLRTYPSSPAVGAMVYQARVDSKTRLYVRFLSGDDRRKGEEGFVFARVSNQSKSSGEGPFEHTRLKGSTDTYLLMSQRFQMVRQGEWIRGDIRIDEVMELFQNEVVDSSHVYKPADASPGTYKLRGSVTLQLPSAQPVSSLKDLPPDTVTTVTVLGATPTDPFPHRLDLKLDLGRVLLDAGFEYKKGARLEKRGLTYGEAKGITQCGGEPVERYVSTKGKVLKPCRQSIGDVCIFFKSQEVNPTWSDDTKVDVYVYLPPQMDEVVKGLLKKKTVTGEIHGRERKNRLL
jgi:hypothetical protein